MWVQWCHLANTAMAMHPVAITNIATVLSYFCARFLPANPPPEYPPGQTDVEDIAHLLRRSTLGPFTNPIDTPLGSMVRPALESRTANEQNRTASIDSQAF